MHKVGKVEYGGNKYFICIKDGKKEALYYLLNKYTRECELSILRDGIPNHDIVLESIGALEKHASINYVVEAMMYNKVSGEIQEAFSGCNVIQKIIDIIAMIDTYKPRVSTIEHKDRYTKNGIIVDEIVVNDNNISFEYRKENTKFTRLIATYQDVKLDIIVGKFSNIKKDYIKWRALKENNIEKQLTVSTLDKITYDMLSDKLDMSWYENKKEYMTIGSKDDLEKYIITPLAIAAAKASEDNKLLLSLDTEATGLNFFNLSRDNKNNDRCVAIPISWEDNKAYTIFTDMEYFESIPNEYVWERLKPFLEAPKIVNGVEQPIEYMTQDGVIIFYRSNINLIGHNVLFDGRVAYSEGVDAYFDDDTLQMTFVVHPNTTRGSKALKNLTRRVFGHETPELKDILGKGNEDKYRYLSDRRVAEVYGCADADYTRLLFKYLRKLIGDKLYTAYKRQDIPLLNILYKSEYYGLNTDIESVTSLAKRTEEDLKILREFMYSYVGNIVELEKKRLALQARSEAGLISEDELNSELKTLYSCVDFNSRYEFELKASDIINVMYNILKYPIYGYTDNESSRKPKTDKYVMKKLYSQKIKEGETGPWDKGFKIKNCVFKSGYSQKDYDNLVLKGAKKKAQELVLIDADEFNTCKYPLALVLQKYAELNKDYTSYYKPIVEQNMDGKLFKGYSMATILTRRISNPAQTMKSDLKNLIIPYSQEYYLLDFDMSQVEYRIMSSEAGHTHIIDKMRDPENDFHIETASLMFGIPAYEVSKKARKNAKSFGFGKPYGLGERSMCESLFGNTSYESMLETIKLSNIFDRENKPVINFLEMKRDEALREEEVSLEYRNFIDAWERDYVYNSKGSLISKEYKRDKNGNKIPTPLGFVRNRLGFYRVFDLSDKSNKKISQIRRMAGNFPIQSFAAELFRIILIRFYNACKKYGIEDKVIWHMLVHDELLCSVHKSVHPFLIYKIVKEACMVTLPGHTNYFVGINVGNTWGEVKSDEREAPVKFVEEIVERWDKGEFKEEWIDDVWAYVKPFREDFLKRRIYQCLKDIQPNIDNEPVNIPLILEKFTNYTVKSYVYDFKQNHTKYKVDSDDTKTWVSHLEGFILDYFGEKKAVNSDGNYYLVQCDSESKKSFSIEFEEDIVDTITEQEYDNWSFDEEGFEVSYNADTYIDDFEDNEDYIREAELVDHLNKDKVKAVSLAQMIDKKTMYSNIIINSSTIIVNAGRAFNHCVKFLKEYITSEDVGKKVMVRSSISNIVLGYLDNEEILSELDNMLTERKIMYENRNRLRN